MKVLITGGAGFLGSHITDKLLAARNSVIVYDNLSSGSKGRICHNLKNPLFKFVQGDLLNFEDTAKVVRGCDMVFHMASNPDISRGITETDLDLRLGVLTLYNILESMRLADVGRIFFPSGSGVYGDVGLTSTDERFGPLLPVSLYGASKLACEALISAFCHMFDIQAWVGRLANIVGARQTHGVVLDFLKKLKRNASELDILGDGSQSKSYVHARDCVEAIMLIVNRSVGRVNTFNIAGPDCLDVTSIAKIVTGVMGLHNVRVRYSGGDRGWKGDVPRVRMDTSKIVALGWKCSMTSSEAVEHAARELLRELES